MSKLNTKHIIRIVFFVFLLLIAKPVFAQEAELSLSISPPTLELSANPGDSLSNSIRVDNLTDKPIKVTVERRNFTAMGEEGAIGLTEEDTSFSLAAWIEVFPQEVEIPANTSQNYIFTVNVPLSAEPGGHFGSIVFKTGGAMPGQTGAALTQELGALILLRVAGQAQELAILESFVTTQNFFEYGPIDFIIRIKNEGNVHLRPTGTITVNNMFGKKIADLNIESRNVLPDAVRRLESQLNEKNLLGYFTATAQVNYGRQSESLTATSSFWVFPYRIGGPLIVGVLLVLYLLWKARKRLKTALRVFFRGQ